MTGFVDKNGVPQPDRRKQRYLRELFDDVVHRVALFFQEGSGLNGQRTDYWVTRTIRDAHPDLSNEEVHMLANAAIRYYLGRQAESTLDGQIGAG